jgi:hypothetical protein
LHGLSYNELKSFIAGLTDSDGHIYSRQRDGRDRLCIATISALESNTLYRIFKILGYEKIYLFPLITKNYPYKPRLIICVSDPGIYEEFRDNKRSYLATKYPSLFYAGFFYGDGYLKYKTRLKRDRTIIYLDRNYFEITSKKSERFIKCLMELSNKYGIHYRINKINNNMLSISVSGEPLLYNILGLIKTNYKILIYDFLYLKIDLKTLIYAYYLDYDLLRRIIVGLIRNKTNIFLNTIEEKLLKKLHIPLTLDLTDTNRWNIFSYLRLYEYNDLVGIAGSDIIRSIIPIHYAINRLKPQVMNSMKKMFSSYLRNRLYVYVKNIIPTSKPM